MTIMMCIAKQTKAKPYAERLIKLWEVLKDKALEDAEGNTTYASTFVFYILMYFMKPQVVPLSFL
jgi:hypothetical protein